MIDTNRSGPDDAHIDGRHRSFLVTGEDAGTAERIGHASDEDIS